MKFILKILGIVLVTFFKIAFSIGLILTLIASVISLFTKQPVLDIIKNFF